MKLSILSRSSVSVFAALLLVIGSHIVVAQKTCTSNPTTLSSDINFGSVTWTAGGGATVSECNDMADGLITFTGNVLVDLSNNTTLTISNDVNITGNFPISGGPGSLLSITGSSTLHVTGDLGDNDNNGVQYNVATADDEIIVDGTLYGKNNNAFTGLGSISGGRLEVKTGSTCGTPCPVTGGFSSCGSGDTFCSSNNVLPIVLSYFSAEIPEGETHVLVEWGTEEEESFDHFEVERAGSDLEFASIIHVPGAGYNTNSLQKYSAYDENPLLGTSYYRLKAVDINGSFEYFSVAAVTYNGVRNFYVSPNPASGFSIKYNINFDPAASDRVVLVDAVGNEMATESVTGSTNELTPTKALPPGVYLLRYVSSDYQQVVRVFVKE